jgi:hypothetical protein
MSTISDLLTATQTYELTLPSNGKKIEYRPFLVKEEKVLLLASESKNEKEMYRAMQNVVSACTFTKVDMSDSPMIDIEYLFIKIRSRSVGETAKPTIKCSKCSEPNEMIVDLAGLEPTINPNHKSKIEISKDVILDMRYPKFSDIEKIQGVESESQRIFALMSVCIEKIYSPRGTIVTKDLDNSEVIEFLDNLTQAQFTKISEFFETMPQLKKEIEYKCKKCNNNETITLRGAQDFF